MIFIQAKHLSSDSEAAPFGRSFSKYVLSICLNTEILKIAPYGVYRNQSNSVTVAPLSFTLKVRPHYRLIDKIGGRAAQSCDLTVVSVDESQTAYKSRTKPSGFRSVNIREMSDNSVQCRRFRRHNLHICSINFSFRDYFQSRIIEWCKGDVLTLIKMYKDHENLWNCTSNEYKNKNKRHDVFDSFWPQFLSFTTPPPLMRLLWVEIG